MAYTRIKNFQILNSQFLNKLLNMFCGSFLQSFKIYLLTLCTINKLLIK